ncbi:MAG: PAS domain S-box protein [Candidatus Thorarchaeota archaeon]|nr:PAS domain S-box protein [Candidatus Thorarchaeota archaeon]
MYDEMTRALKSNDECEIFKMFFEASPQGVIIVRDRKIEYINKWLSNKVGIPYDMAIGQDVSDLASVLAEDQREEALQRFTNLMEKHHQVDQDRYSFTSKDGETVILEITANTLDISGKKYIIAYASDMTKDEMSKKTIAQERKAYSIIAEAALSTENLSQVCKDVLQELIDTLDFEVGTIRLFVEESNSLELIASVNLDTTSIADSVSVDDSTYLVARTARTLEPLFVEDVTKSSESIDRMSRAISIGIKTLIFWPIIGADRSLVGVINIASRKVRPLTQDHRIVFATIAGMFGTVLERKRTDEQLKDSQEQFKAFADNMPGPVYIKDHDSRVVFINHYMKNMPPRTDWEGLKNIDLFRQDRAAMLTEEDQKVLVRGPIDRIQEVRDRDGKIKIFRTHKFPIFRDGKPPLIGGFSLDITERIEAQKQREEALARAEWATDLMAHDLNNMHQGIMASLELILEDEYLPDRLRIMAENALMQVNRSVSLISNVKKFSLVNQSAPALEKTDPANSLFVAIETVKQSFPNRPITVKTNIERGSYCIMADDFLQDVFYNLLHNAVKFTASKDVYIEVNTEVINDGEFLKMEFLDWGDGIDDHTKERLFTGMSDHIRRISGVGLTLVKQIIDNYRGSIRIENRVKGDHSKGSRFIVLLPHGC